MSSELIKVWFLPLRIFHWLLVIGFFTAYLSKDSFGTVHVWAGYLVTALLVFRVIWGFVGDEYARFSHFVCSPMRSIAYVKDLINGKVNRYIGHNPAGAAMIVIMLFSLFVTVISGIAVYGADQGAGPLAFIGDSHEELLEKLHRWSGKFSLILVGIHILGVIVESIIHKENLARSMFYHGNKRK